MSDRIRKDEEVGIAPLGLIPGPGKLAAEFTKGRVYQNELCTPKLNHYRECLEALQEIAAIRNRFPWDPNAAATECIRLAKVALQGQP